MEQSEAMVITGHKWKQKIKKLFITQHDSWFVYSWFREDVCLYIGSCRYVYHRLLSHNIINKTLEVLDTDVFFIEPQPTEEAARCIERQMILVIHPRFNKTLKCVSVKIERMSYEERKQHIGLLANNFCMDPITRQLILQ